jgi:hypothetical protein
MKERLRGSSAFDNTVPTGPTVRHGANAEGISETVQPRKNAVSLSTARVANAAREEGTDGLRI